MAKWMELLPWSCRVLLAVTLPCDVSVARTIGVSADPPEPLASDAEKGLDYIRGGTVVDWAGNINALKLVSPFHASSRLRQ